MKSGKQIFNTRKRFSYLNVVQVKPIVALVGSLETTPLRLYYHCGFYSYHVFLPSGKKDKGKKGSKEDETKKKKPEEDEDLGFKMAPSNFLADLMVCNSEYDDLWKHMDESSNPLQTHYLEMVRAAKTAEVEAELRKVS